MDDNYFDQQFYNISAINVKPDIVFLDITMPNVDGLTALKEIITFDSNAKVVMCSAMGTESNVIEALQLRAKDFIVKPNFDSLGNVLEKRDKSHGRNLK